MMKWITESKPEETGEYIVTTIFGEVMPLGYWNGYWNAHENSAEYAMADDHIVAWMPLPEAYKEGENNG